MLASDQDDPPECHGQAGDRHEPETMEPSGTPTRTAFECPVCDTEVEV